MPRRARSVQSPARASRLSGYHGGLRHVACIHQRIPRRVDRRNRPDRGAVRRRRAPAVCSSRSPRSGPAGSGFPRASPWPPCSCAERTAGRASPLGALLSAAITDWHWPSAMVAAAYATGEALLAVTLLHWGGPFDRTLQNVGTVLRFVASVTLSAARHGDCRRLEPDRRSRPVAGAATARRGSPSGSATPWPCSPSRRPCWCGRARGSASPAAGAARSLRRCWPPPSSSARWCSASRPGRCTSCCRWPTPASR